MAEERLSHSPILSKCNPNKYISLKKSLGAVKLENYTSQVKIQLKSFSALIFSSTIVYTTTCIIKRNHISRTKKNTQKSKRKGPIRFFFVMNSQN